jgi:hypothetical protein
MSFLRFVIVICFINAFLGVYILGSMHDKRRKEIELRKYYEDTSMSFLSVEGNGTRHIIFLHEISSNIISALAQNTTNTDNRRVKKFNEYLDLEVAKISGSNITEFYDLFKLNELFKNLLNQPLTKRNSLIESFVKLQITVSVFLKQTDANLSDLKLLLKQMLVKTHSQYLVTNSQLIMHSPSAYISTHYKSFYLS